MTWRLLDCDDGVATYHMLDEASNKTIIKTVQDVEPIFNINQQKRNEAARGWKGDFHEVAAIPEVLWDDWWRELGSNPGSKENRAWLVAKLNNRDFFKVRTKEGHI